MRRAPVALASCVLSVSLLLIWIVSAEKAVSGLSPDIYGRSTLGVGVDRGVFVAEWSGHRGQQSARDDRWSFGLDWLDLGVWYTGTYLRPGTINIQWDRYQVRAPLWLAAALFAAYPALVAVRGIRRRAGGRPCARCGYDLTGNVSGRCPECGTTMGAGGRQGVGG